MTPATTAQKAFAAARRKRTDMIDTGFRWLCGACTWGGVLLLFVLIGKILVDGLGELDMQFLTSYISRRASNAGIKAGIWGSVWLSAITAAIAIPIGISAAIYLEEYSHKSRMSRFIETNISNLAGVPSIVYGILGLAIFVRQFDFGPSIFAGGLTLALLVLPVIIVASREAIRAVPPGIRHASYALGATKWQTTYKVVLPGAMPGILTGVILALSRAVGETAPLILVGAAYFITSVPSGPGSSYTALPMLIYDFASRPQKEFQDLAAAGIIVLLVVLLLTNGVAIWLRQRFLSRLKGH